MFPALPLGVGNLPAGNHAVCEGLCCSRHVSQMETDSPDWPVIKIWALQGTFFFLGAWLLCFESYQPFSSSK